MTLNCTVYTAGWKTKILKCPKLERTTQMDVNSQWVQQFSDPFTLHKVIKFNVTIISENLLCGAVKFISGGICSECQVKADYKWHTEISELLSLFVLHLMATHQFSMLVVIYCSFKHVKWHIFAVFCVEIF